jgi:hypothetical protein
VLDTDKRRRVLDADDASQRTFNMGGGSMQASAASDDASTTSGASGGGGLSS